MTSEAESIIITRRTFDPLLLGGDIREKVLCGGHAKEIEYLDRHQLSFDGGNDGTIFNAVISYRYPLRTENWKDVINRHYGDGALTITLGNYSVCFQVTLLIFKYINLAFLNLFHSFY